MLAHLGAPWGNACCYCCWRVEDNRVGVPCPPAFGRVVPADTNAVARVCLFLLCPSGLFPRSGFHCGVPHARLPSWAVLFCFLCVNQPRHQSRARGQATLPGAGGRLFRWLACKCHPTLTFIQAVGCSGHSLGFLGEGDEAVYGEWAPTWTVMQRVVFVPSAMWVILW